LGGIEKRREIRRRKMGKTKKQLLSSAPWRDEESDEFKDAKVKVTSEPGTTPTMHVPRKKSVSSSIGEEDDSLSEIDPELRYTFQRNFQVLSLSPARCFILAFNVVWNFVGT